MIAKRHFSFLLALVLLALTVSASPAQTTRGRIEGVVRDPQGRVVPNASISATNTGTGAILQSVSSSEGTFVVPEIQPGTYKVTVEVHGFKKFEVVGVVVHVATVTSLTVDLEVGQLTEAVTVNADNAQEIVNTSNAEVGDVIDRQRILDLPLDGRNPLELTTLQAGVQISTGADGENTRFSINGNRTVANNVTIDGVNASDNFLKTPANIVLPLIPVSVESVGEFRVTTALASAEFGRGTAQINAITASGTNQFRGSLFWFHRNTVFNANTFFNNATINPDTGRSVPREPLIRNQYGGRLGGPIKRDRTHFFFSYEGKREVRGVSRNRTVYTAEARNGIFRYLKGRPTTPSNVAVAPMIVPASSCGLSATPAGAICFVNLYSLNPATRGAPDPVVAGMIAPLALPNNFQVGDGVNTGGFRFNARLESNNDQLAIRLDHKLTAKHHFEMTYNYGDINFLGDFINEGEELYPGAPDRDRLTLGRGLTGTLRSILSSTVINEFRFGAQISNLRFVNGAEFPAGYQVTFAQITGPVYTFLNTGRNLRVLQWTDNLTWARGTHTFRMGFDARSLWARRFSRGGLLPLADFDFGVNNPGLTRSQFPGIPNNTADFDRARGLINTLAGAVGTVSQTFNVTSRDSGFVSGAPEIRTYANRELDLYAQDSWRARPNLTFSLGLRYEYSTAPRELNGLALLPVGGSKGLYGVSGPNGQFHPGVLEGTPTVLDFADQLFRADKNNIAPVLGFAWDPFKSGKTSLRGGYRVSYVRSHLNLIDGLLTENQGLEVAVDSAPGGFLRDGIAPLTPPAFSIPAPQSIQVNSIVDVRAFDENLRTPYVQEWTLSIQREVLPKTSLEVRYIGNHGVKLYRAADVNEINIFAIDPNTGQRFIDAFLIAQNNLALFRAANPTATPNFRYNPAIPGSMPNPLFENVLFFNLPNEFTNTNYITRLEQGRAGDMADFISRVRLIGNERGNPFFAAVRRGQLPINFFRVNPDVRGAQLFGNSSFSTYHALQVEMQRRFSGGLRFQVSYTFAKGLSDFIGGQTDTNSFLTIRNTRLETGQFNNTHQVLGNFIYQLPLGRGRKYLRKAKGLPHYFLGGWQMSGIVRWTSGDPLNITSGRGTFNRDDRSALNTVDVRGGLDRNALQNLAGVRILSTGIFYFDPNIAPGSTSDPNLIIFDNPRAGAVGSLGLSQIFGPRYFNVDFSMLKRTRLRETMNLEFRAEIFNIFNTVNFGNPVTAINSSNFGRITTTVGRPRLMQFALRLNF